MVLLAAWIVRIVRRRERWAVVAVGMAIAVGGVLGEAALSAAGEFDYLAPDLLGVPWWLFPLYLHGALVATDLIAVERAYRLRDMPPSTGSMTPERNPAAGDSRNAAARPNSSGLP